MKILLADDEPIARTMVEHWLAGWGYETVCVRDGRAALEALRSDPEIHIALLDWVMSEMDGVDVCKKLREEDRQLPVHVIMLMARDDKKELTRALDSGADDFLLKPCNPLELRVRVQAGCRLVELRQELDQARKQLRALAARD